MTVFLRQIFFIIDLVVEFNVKKSLTYLSISLVDEYTHEVFDMGVAKEP